MNELETYQKALDAWGEEMQLIILMEECGELIQAASKYIREKDWKTENAIKLIEEAVDVQLVINQLREVMLNFPVLWEEAKRDKLDRLKLRLLEETQA